MAVSPVKAVLPTAARALPSPPTTSPSSRGPAPPASSGARAALRSAQSSGPGGARSRLKALSIHAPPAPAAARPPAPQPALSRTAPAAIRAGTAAVAQGAQGVVVKAPGAPRARFSIGP